MTLLGLLLWSTIGIFRDRGQFIEANDRPQSSGPRLSGNIDTEPQSFPLGKDCGLCGTRKRLVPSQQLPGALGQSETGPGSEDIGVKSPIL